MTKCLSEFRRDPISTISVGAILYTERAEIALGAKR